MANNISPEASSSISDYQTLASTTWSASTPTNNVEEENDNDNDDDVDDYDDYEDGDYDDVEYDDDNNNNNDEGGGGNNKEEEEEEEEEDNDDNDDSNNRVDKEEEEEEEDAKDKYVVWCISAWVTRPERPKGAKDEVKMIGGPRMILHAHWKHRHRRNVTSHHFFDYYDIHH